MNVKRKYYLDVLRICAISAVVLMHCAGFADNDVNPSSVLWNSAIIFNNITKYAVPVFVMISGSLMLGRTDISLKQLFQKYIFRLVTAYIFWSFIYTFIYSYIAYYGTFSVIALKNLVSGTLKGGYFHLWYMPLIIGLYVISPVLRSFITNAPKQIIAYWMAFNFLICFVVPVLQYSENFKLIFSESLDIFCDGFWGVYVFYFALGYLIDNIDIPQKWRRTIYLLGISGTILSVLLVWSASFLSGELHTEFAANDTLNVFLASLALFVFVKDNLKNWQPKHNKCIRVLSSLSFGVYFVHELIAEKLHVLIFSLVPSILAIPVLFLITIVSSYSLIWIISKIKPIARYIT